MRSRYSEKWWKWTPTGRGFYPPPSPTYTHTHTLSLSSLLRLPFPLFSEFEWLPASFWFKDRLSFLGCEKRVVADLQLVRLRRLFWATLCAEAPQIERGSERERTAHRPEARRRERKAHRFQWNSAGSPAHWMRATDLYDNGEQTETHSDGFMEIRAT